MRVVLWIVLITWIAALLRTILNLLSVPRLPAGAPDDGPFVSIIIPARNEERTIERTVRAFLAQTYRSFEVIVVDDRSSDSTPSIVQRIDDRRLRLVAGEEPPRDWLGQPWALEQGSRVARGELLLFADADIVYAPDALGAAVAELQRSGAAMVTILPHFEMRGFFEQVAMPMLPLVFALLPVWLSNRSRIPWLALGAGSGNLAWRRNLETIGWFEPLKSAVIDDIGLARAIRRSGGLTRAVRGDDLISVRMYHSGWEIVEGFTKNLFFALGRSYVLGFALLGSMFLLHLLPYALALTGNALALASVAVITIVRVIVFRSMRYRLDNALLLHPLMIVFWSFVVLRSMWMLGVRNEVCWRGRTYEASETQLGAGDIRAAQEKS